MKNFPYQKRQTAVKGRSSALVITIVVHVVFFLIAGTYVAMEVIERQEAKFEAKQVARPKMQLKKLRVPVKIQKQARKTPTMSSRLTANPNVNVKSVDFKMPETAGLGGGGSLGASAGFAGNLGFASSQIDLFGLKSSGEKIIFLLDAGGSMMGDEIGGIPAYTIIKKELLSMVDIMPPTALFNVLVFTPHECRALSPDMLPASDASLQRFKQWIMPLNAQDQKYGLETLGSAGTPIEFEPFPTVFNSDDNWVAGLGYAAHKGADVVYWLGNNDYMDNIYDKYYRACKKGEPLPYPGGWPPELPMFLADYTKCGGIEGWHKMEEKAQKLRDEETKERLAKGIPARVNPTMLGEGWWMVMTYLPEETLPEVINMQEGKGYGYTSDDLADYLEAVSRNYSRSGPAVSLGLKKKELVFNAIHFVKILDQDNPDVRLAILAPLAEELNGEYIKIGGGASIR